MGLILAFFKFDFKFLSFILLKLKWLMIDMSNTLSKTTHSTFVCSLPGLGCLGESFFFGRQIDPFYPTRGVKWVYDRFFLAIQLDLTQNQLISPVETLR